MRTCGPMRNVSGSPRSFPRISSTAGIMATFASSIPLWPDQTRFRSCRRFTRRKISGLQPEIDPMTSNPSNKTRVLTGITTTGTPHLGNYVGAIKPAIAASQDPNVQSYYFLADLHALIKCQDPRRVQDSRLEIAATWLALGLDT